MRALILADGDAPDRATLDAAWPDWDDDIGFVVAADGGARHAAGLHVAIDLWVGDGDSLGEEGLAALVAAGVPVERSRSDKDASDTELAVRAALLRDPGGLVILGALGGPRVDHALANIGLLTIPELRDRPTVILDRRTRIGWLRAPAVSAPAPSGGATAAPTKPAGPGDGVVTWQLAGRPGDLVTLLPLAHPVEGVTTLGLAYPLHDEPLLEGSTRGLSNVIERAGARVSLRAGSLLVVETPATFRA